MNTIDWSRYDLYAKHKRSVDNIGYRFRLSPSETEEIATSVALEFCLRAEFDVKHYVAKCRFRILDHIKEEKAQFVRYQNCVNSDGEDIDEGTTLTILGAVTKPKQEEFCFAMQVISELEKLPSAHRNIMFRLAGGETPIDIAVNDHRPVGHVLGDIRTARDWVRSWAQDEGNMV